MRETEQHIRTPRAYKVCDGVTEGIIYFMVVFTPWAFGTTQNWSIWTMNVSAYLLGGLLITKWVIRWKMGYVPVRWGREAIGDRRWAIGEGQGVRNAETGVRSEEAGEGRLETEVSEVSSQGSGVRGQRMVKVLTVALASLTIFILAYCLTSAINARASFDSKTNSFEYHDHIEWLPHSYDKDSTWQAFWTYLGLALFFWATRDWLLGKTSKERRMSSGESRDENQISPEEDQSLRVPAATIPLEYSARAPNRAPEAGALPIQIPTRLRRLLWLLCLNGGLLALEGILQRLDGTNKLLWLIKPSFTGSAAQFGPYAYRSNAAAYLNLIWPVCLGLWLSLRKAAARRRAGSQRVGGGSHAFLLPCIVLMAASPIFSGSRGGAIVAIGQLLAAAVILFFATRRDYPLVRASAMSVLIFILALTSYLGWKQLQERFEDVFVDNLSGRTEIYANSKQIAADFPMLGTGPGSFGSVYLLYKEHPQTWEAYLHDDWLEIRITFGWIGFGVILLMLVMTLLRWFTSTGIQMPWEFISLLWLAMAGCLIHAKFDFPFQIYSIAFLFLLLCSINFCVSRKV